MVLKASFGDPRIYRNHICAAMHAYPSHVLNELPTIGNGFRTVSMLLESAQLLQIASEVLLLFFL